MKFNQALIAAVATSAMLMSPVFASYDCDATAGRAGGVVAANTDCGACKPDHCATSDSDPSKAYSCVEFDSAIQNCATADPWGVSCKAPFHIVAGKTCTAHSDLANVQSTCADAAAKNLGKMVIPDSKDANKPVCGCEHGPAKVLDNAGKEVDACACPDLSGAKQVRNIVDGSCGPVPAPKPFDCAALGRSDNANTTLQISAESCGECKNVGECKVGKDKDDKAYKCVAAPTGAKCDASNQTITCDGEFNYNPNSNACEAKDKKEKNTVQKNDTETEPTETLEQKCNKLNRKTETDKCGACKDDNHSSLKKDDVASKCFPHADKTKCEASAKTTKRVFDEASKLCTCPGNMVPTTEGKESSIDDVCKNAAGQLVISSIVLLSSLAASALFFL